MQKQFLPAFHRGRWWFLTISFTRSALVGWHAKEDISLWWDACRWALWNMLAAGVFRGVFVFEALHVESYWPHPLVLPHLHVTVLEKLGLDKLELFAQDAAVLGTPISELG